MLDSFMNLPMILLEASMNGFEDYDPYEKDVDWMKPPRLYWECPACREMVPNDLSDCPSCGFSWEGNGE